MLDRILAILRGVDRPTSVATDEQVSATQTALECGEIEKVEAKGPTTENTETERITGADVAEAETTEIISTEIEGEERDATGVESSGIDIAESESDANKFVGVEYFAADGRDFENLQNQIADNYRPFSNGSDYYRNFVEQLATERSISVLPVFEAAKNLPHNKPVVSVRHDIDGDPETAVKLARYLARIGLSASFYLLHSALYYGENYNGVFVRNPMLVSWLRSLMVAGAEIGIHNDCLGMFYAHGVDPVAVLQTELAWLRAQGANVRGSVAHNSIMVPYEAENYEIFAERVLWQRAIKDVNGNEMFPGRISMADLSLDYEGTFAITRDHVDVSAIKAFAKSAPPEGIRSQTWMKSYLIENPYCGWDIDYQIWLVDRDQWVIAGGDANSDVFEWNVKVDGVLQFVRELPAGTHTMIVLHPEYFGDY